MVLLCLLWPLFFKYNVVVVVVDVDMEYMDGVKNGCWQDIGCEWSV